MREMRQGNFESAWKVSDEVGQLRRGRSCSHLPRHLQWVWNGRPLVGRRVLIRSYHGLGDTVQFIRYASLVKKIATNVSVLAQPELLPLLRTMSGAFDTLLPLQDASPNCEFDVDVELMELPHAFRTTLADLPADIPYLHVEPARLEKRGKPNVGLVWTAGDWDERRSIPFHIVRQLTNAEGIAWHILQRGPALNEWKGAFGTNSGNNDVLQVAQQIAAMDLLVSVDTLTAHVGGALGVPTWTLLHSDPDWRWMNGRSDSPWYPTMRLFRQRRAGDWQSVIETLLAQLRAAITKSPRSARSAPGAAHALGG
jgi:hypothetical protein